MQTNNIDEHFQDAPISDEMCILYDKAREKAQQQLYPKCLPIYLKSIKDYVGALKKYYQADKSDPKKKENASSVYKLEIEQIQEQLILVLPQAEQIYISLGVSLCVGAGLFAYFGILAPGTGIFGMLLGALALFSFTKKDNRCAIQPRNYLLMKAEKVLGLQGEEYTQEDLEEIFKEKSVYHPDKYKTQVQKKAFSKKFIEYAESYELIKQLKYWQ
ncbi:hypothetical protein ABPG74_000888 [Tetrahymena malaccensis]